MGDSDDVAIKLSQPGLNAAYCVLVSLPVRGLRPRSPTRKAATLWLEAGSGTRRAFGLRQSRYIGLAKTGLQQACTAAAMNVTRIVNWLEQKPRAKTRVTRFTALAQAA